MKLHEMQQKRETIARQMRELNDSAKNEKRAFSDEDNKRWGDMQKELSQLDGAIEREQQLRDMDDRLAADNEQRQEPQGDAEVRQMAAFNTWLRHGAAELTSEQRSELRAMGTATDSKGGFTVPTQFRDRVVEVMKAYGGIASVCQLLNTSTGNPLEWTITDGTAEMGAMIGENTAAGEEDATLDQVTLGAKKGTSNIIKISNELLQDSGVDIDALLARRVGQRLGRLEAHQLVNGDGTGNNIKGVLNQITGTHAAAAAAAVAYVDMIGLKHSVDPAYRLGPNVRWAFNDNVLKGFKLMQDSEGRPLWLPAISGVAPATIDGDQYVIDQGLATPATGKTSVLYGDFHALVLRRVQYMALRRLTERYAEADQMGFIGFHRFDAVLEDVAAIKGLSH